MRQFGGARNSDVDGVCSGFLVIAARRGGGRNEAFYAVVKTHKRRSNKIYNSELIMTKI